MKKKRKVRCPECGTKLSKRKDSDNNRDVVYCPKCDFEEFYRMRNRPLKWVDPDEI